MGLLTWKGKFDVKAAGLSKLGGFKAKFLLTSECDIDGKQGVAVVTGWGATLGIGLPMSQVKGEVTFEDGNIRVDPDVFEGDLTIDSIGITIGGIDIGYTSIVLGDAVSTSVSSHGLDAGISFGIHGKSKVINKIIYQKCGCNSGTGPVEHSY